jgi:uncharacterized membrane protein YkvA (DUF1232 family)
MDGAILMPCSDSTAQIGSTPHLSRRSSSGWAKTADAVSRISLASSGGKVDAMDKSDLLTLVLMLLGVLALLGVAVIGFVMWRYRIPPRGLIAMIGALVYLASPVDVLPEVMLGPLGILDDAGAVTAAAVFVYKLVTVKRRLQDAGVKGRRRPDLLE